MIVPLEFDMKELAFYCYTDGGFKWILKDSKLATWQVDLYMESDMLLKDLVK